MAGKVYYQYAERGMRNFDHINCGIGYQMRKKLAEFSIFAV